MQPRMWKRLQAVETSLSYQHRQVVIVSFIADETEESFIQRVERWKAGETVAGIEGIYEGGDFQPVGVRGVSARPQKDAAA